MHQTTTRLRALSIESTEKSVSGEPVGVSAILMSLLRSCPPATASRKCSVPVASGVPMLRYRPSEPHRPAEHPAAWKTLPVTWSIAGYPSAPKGEYTAPSGTAVPSSAVPFTKIRPSVLLFHWAPPFGPGPTRLLYSREMSGLGPVYADWLGVPGAGS